MRMRLLVFLLSLSASVFAQVSNVPALIAQRGITTPAVCTIGQLFFDTDATPGYNIFGCTAASTWSAESSGTGVGSSTDGQILVNSGGNVAGENHLCTISGTWGAGRMLYGTSLTACSIFVPSTALQLNTSGVGPGDYAGSSISGQCVTGLSAAGVLTGSTTCTAGASGTLGTYCLGNATSGTLCFTSVTGALGSTTLTMPVAVGTGRITQVIAAGTSTFGTSAVASGACASVVTTAATGTATTDVINYSANADWSATTGYSGVGTILTIYKYPTANNVNWKVCNWTASSITPSAVTVNWSVTR